MHASKYQQHLPQTLNHPLVEVEVPAALVTTQ